MQNRTDQSYGIIPVRHGENGIEIFLIQQYSHIGDNTYWVFPKGHAEGEESPRQAAERELLEETGLSAERIIESPTFELAYRFSFEGERVDKTVEFFVAYIGNDQTPILDPKEVRDGGWFPLKNVRERLDYDDTKKLFDSVQQYLETGKE